MSLIAEHAADRTASDLKSTLKTQASVLNRWLYPFAGLVMLALTVVGFQLFYFKGQSYPGRPITPPIRGLVIAHGLAMSAWIVLFAVQPMLIGLRRHRLHMTLGRIGAVLALLVVVLGLSVAVMSARVTPPEVVIWGLTPERFFAVPFCSILLFAGFVSVGVWKRKRPAVHRAAMMFGTLTAVSAALGRIDAMNNVYVGTVWDRLYGPFFSMLVIGAGFVALRVVVTRRIERPLVACFLVLAAAGWLIPAMARTDAWVRFAHLFIGG